jgi:hypothetical protein
METSIVAAVEKLVSGDMAMASLVYELPHEQLAEASRDTHLVLTRCAVVNVLRGLTAGGISDSDAQQWASFVRRGYVSKPADGAVKPIAIDYELQFEDAIVEAIGRMDEIGDAVDGKLDDEEIQGLLDELEAHNCP